MLKTSARFTIYALLLCAPLACTQTAVTPIYQPCELVETLPSDLESTDLTGFSASAVLSALSEPFTAQVTYKNGATSNLTANLTYSGGEIQRVEKVLNGNDPDLYFDQPCASYIDIETTLSLTSEDGLLDITETVHLQAYGVDYALIGHEVVSGGLEELLNASEVSTSNSDRVRYYLNNTWREGAITGSATATVEPNANAPQSSASESIVSIEIKYLAEW